MVGKDEDLGDIDDESLACVKLIANKKRQLEQTADQVRQSIRGSFGRLAEALRCRERQLLRQVEAIHRQQLSLVQSNSELLPTVSSLDAVLAGEVELAERLLNFGMIELANGIAVNDSEPYKAEEYFEAGEDVISFDKSLKTEAEEFDVSSVIRRKRDSHGNPSRNISINLNCTSCESCKFETGKTQVLAVATMIKHLDQSPVTPVTPIFPVTPKTPSTSSESSIFKESDEEQSAPKECQDDYSEVKESNDEILIPGEIESPVATDMPVNFYFEDAIGTNFQNVTTEQSMKNDDDTSKLAEIVGNNAITKAQEKLKDGATEHPVQIQQWLKQILAETETEPIIHEIGQFSKIPNTRLYREFPVET